MQLRKPGISAEVVKFSPLCRHILSFVIWQPCRCDENETKPGPILINVYRFILRNEICTHADLCKWKNHEKQGSIWFSRL